MEATDTHNNTDRWQIGPSARIKVGWVSIRQVATSLYAERHWANVEERAGLGSDSWHGPVATGSG